MQEGEQFSNADIERKQRTCLRFTLTCATYTDDIRYTSFPEFIACFQTISDPNTESILLMIVKFLFF